MNKERDIAEIGYLTWMMYSPRWIDGAFPELFSIARNRTVFLAVRTEYEKTRPHLDPIAAFVNSGMTHADFVKFGYTMDGELVKGNASYEFSVKDSWLSEIIAKAGRDASVMPGIDALMHIERVAQECNRQLGFTNMKASTFDEFLNSDSTLYKTGIGGLDRNYGGFAAGETVIIAGRPGSGKTTLACTLTVNFVSVGIPVVYHSVEMLSSGIWTFVSARVSMQRRKAVSIKEIRTRRPGEEWIPDMVQSWKDLCKMGLDVVDCQGIQVRQLAANIESSNIPIHIVDHIGHVTTEKQQKEYERVTEVSNTLHAAAKRSKRTLIELVQLNRSDTNATPHMSDLRGSGHLEQDADMIIFVHEPERDANKAAGNTVVDVQLIIDKAREGITGAVLARCNRPYAFMYGADSTPVDYTQSTIDEPF